MFTTSLSGKYVFQIKHDPFQQPHFRLTILSEDGEVMHSMDSTDYAELVELHERARRKALKVEDTIQDILAELDKQ